MLNLAVAIRLFSFLLFVSLFVSIFIYIFCLLPPNRFDACSFYVKCAYAQFGKARFGWALMLLHVCYSSFSFHMTW